MTDRPPAYTIWKVIDEKTNKVLFEGKFGQCQEYIKKNNLDKTARNEPFMFFRK
jgi:hypothetical protein